VKVRVGGGRPSYRARRYRGIGAQSKLARKQLFGPAFTHHEHNGVGFFTADLEAEAAAFNGHAGRRGPAAPGTGAAQNVTPAVFAAEDEGALFQSRHNHDAL